MTVVRLPAETTPSTVREALIQALADERLARNTYQAVIKAHGEARPFTRIVKAEERHIEALLQQFERLGYPVPADDGDAGPVGKTLADSCSNAAAAERQNVQLYDRLLAAAADQPQVRKTFERLRAASAERHLPAFERCAQRGQQPGAGHGSAP